MKCILSGLTFGDQSTICTGTSTSTEYDFAFFDWRSILSSAMKIVSYN